MSRVDGLDRSKVQQKKGKSSTERELYRVLRDTGPRLEFTMGTVLW